MPNRARLPVTGNAEWDVNSSSVLYVFVGGNTFHVRHHRMNPCGRKNMTDEQRIFDYCLSRKRRVTEVCFVISVNRFGLLSVRNKLNKNNVSIVILASLSLRNLLPQTSCDTNAPPRFADEIQMGANNCTEI